MKLCKYTFSVQSCEASSHESNRVCRSKNGARFILLSAKLQFFLKYYYFFYEKIRKTGYFL